MPFVINKRYQKLQYTFSFTGMIVTIYIYKTFFLHLKIDNKVKKIMMNNRFISDLG